MVDEEDIVIVPDTTAIHGEPTVEQLINQAAIDDPSLKDSHFDMPQPAAMVSIL